eukprot:jgi/Chrzof1/3722/Cz13g06160.t1
MVCRFAGYSDHAATPLSHHSAGVHVPAQDVYFDRKWWRSYHGAGKVTDMPKRWCPQQQGRSSWINRGR